MSAVVVGGGIAGLASAALLAADGHEVTLLERSAALGGRAGELQAAGFTFDTGPSWYLMPEVFDHFFARFGTSADQEYGLIDLDPGYRVYGAGAAQVDLAPATAREVFESFEPGAGSHLEKYLDSAQRTYDLALDHFLYTNFDPAALPRTLAHADVLRRAGELPGLFGTSLQDRIDSEFSHPLLRQILSFPAVFLGTSPQRAPALFHLMSALDLVAGPQYPVGGMRAVIAAIERIARAQGVRIITGAEAVALDAGPRGLRRARVDRVLARVHDDTEGRTADAHLEEFAADLVVTASDLHHAESLLPPRLRAVSPRRWAQRDPGIGALLIMLGVSGRVPELEHHTLIFAADWEANFSQIFGDAGRGEHPVLPWPASAYVCAPSKTDDTVAPADCENLFVLVPVPAQADLRAGQRGIEDYADRIVDAIGAQIGAPDLRQRTLTRTVMAPGDFTDRFHAWNGTALGPANTLFQSAFFRDQVRHPTVANLYRAGSFTAPGVGLPMCLISADNMAAAVRGESR